MQSRNTYAIFTVGFGVGILGGLIGLGGAEFRLPLLIALFGFTALQAILINKATSLIVVASSLPFRAGSISFLQLLDHWNIIVTLLAGSMIGAWFGAGWATKLKSRTLYHILAVLLVAIAFLLLFGHGPASSGTPFFSGVTLAIVGIIIGFGIGVVASLMGVAGGELLIPTIVLLFGADLKLAGSLSLAVSLPTMIVGFTRYSQDQSFSIIRTERSFLLVIALGSLAGTFIGGQLLGIVPTQVLLPILAVILIFSSVKVWRHA